MTSTACGSSIAICFVTLKRHVWAVSVQQTSVLDGYAFATVHSRVQTYNTAVAVGIVTALGTAPRLPQWLTQIAHDSVSKQGVSLLTGIWGDTKEQMSELCEHLPLATVCPVSQAWG